MYHIIPSPLQRHDRCTDMLDILIREFKGEGMIRILASQRRVLWRSFQQRIFRAWAVETARDADGDPVAQVRR